MDFWLWDAENKTINTITLNGKALQQQEICIVAEGSKAIFIPKETILQLDFGSLNCELMEVGNQWIKKPERDNKWTLMPKQWIELGPYDEVRIPIQFKVKAPPPSVGVTRFSILYNDVKGITVNNLPTVAWVPVKVKYGELHEAMAIELSRSTVIRSEEAITRNNLSVIFKPGKHPRLIMAGPETAFVLSFVYADEYPGDHALTTPARADFIFLAKGTGAGDWKVGSGTNCQTPAWLLRPPPGFPIMGTDSSDPVLFNLDDIATDFVRGVTLMEVAYYNIPGYQDGKFSLALLKVNQEE